MEAYSKDLRERILRDCDAGGTTRVVATKYDVSESWVRRLKQRRRETGETLPRRPGSRRPARWLQYADRLQELVAARPDITLRELRDEIGGALSIQTLSRALRALQWTFKKKSSTRRSKIGRTSRRVEPNGKPR
jgi:transposase